jgi:sigma-B regulation protein RsbU (phosphoserine phosphatase)
MSIRWKLLVVLLIFSLTPLLVNITLNQRVVRQLQDTFSDKTGALLTRIIGNDLQQTTRDFAKILSLEMHSMEMGLKNLARRAERSLTEDSLNTPHIYFNDDFNDPHRAPDGLIPSSKFIRQVTPVEDSAIAVSMEHQVFMLAPGIDRRAVGMDIVRLNSLLGIHQELDHAFGERIYWQYVRLISGVQTIFPGHGNAPQNFIVGIEQWFQLAKDRGRLGWSIPHIDAASGKLVITVSIPLRRPEGTFAGVAAVDLAILKVLLLDVPPSQWTRYTIFYLVSVGKKHKSGNPGFQILAKQGETQSARWVSSRNPEWLTSSNHQQMKRFFDDFQANKYGLTKMPFEEEDSVWAYAHINRDISLIAIAPEKTSNMHLTRTHKRITRWMFLDTFVSATVVIVILVVIALWRSQSLIRPFLVMVEAVQKLARGDFSSRMDYNTGDERDLVANAFNKMVPQLEDRIRMHRALEVAQQVQQTLLPDKNPDFPGFDIVGKVVYCDETGGDYFDFLPYRVGEHSRLGIVVGDVSDHGIGAALLMATARSLIRSLAETTGDLAQRITWVNRLLSADVQRTGNFMTLFYLEITAESPTIRWVRAGNDPAIILTTNTMCFEELAGAGMVLGVDGDYLYKHYERIILPQETIILIGTDGIWDTQNCEGEMFGKKRVREILQSVAHETAKEIQNTLLKALAAFRGDMIQEDDVTIVIIKSV